MSLDTKSKKNLYRFVYIATIGSLMFGFNTGVINGVDLLIKRPDQLGATAAQIGAVASLLTIGAAFGAWFGGAIADKIGRKKLLLLLSVLFTVSTFGCAIVPNISVLIFARLILGFAVGAVSVTVPVYLAEIAPAEERGKIVTMNQLLIVTGQFLAFASNGILSNIFANNPAIWRVMLGVAVIPSVLLLLLVFVIPESPRWLVVNNRLDEAERVLKKVRTEEAAAREIRELKQVAVRESKEEKATIADIFKEPWLLRIVLIGIGLGLVQQVVGINIMMYYGAAILKDAGFSQTVATAANAAIGVVSIIGAAVSVMFINKITRRKLLLSGLAVTTISMGLMTLVSAGIIPLALAVKPVVVFVMVLIFVLVFQGTVGPIPWLVLSEVFPRRIGGLAMGICTFFLWIGNALVAQLFPIMQENLGLNGSFLIFFICNIIGILYVMKFLPETSGKSFDQLEAELKKAV